MSLNITIKDWFARNAGTGNCFVSSGIAYTDPDNILRTGGTGDVVNAFVVAHLLAKDTQVIIAGANYNDLKTINNNTDMTIDDVSWAYANDGHPVGEPQYCITPPELISISITPISASINIGSTRQLTATCKDRNNNAMDCPTLTWISSDDSVVAVSSTGLITGIREGSVIITAYAEGKTSNVSTITVTEVVVPVLTSISITPTSASINIGSTRRLTATCKDQNNNAMDCPTLTWISSDDSVAAVSSTGLVAGISEGSAVITASYGDAIDSRSVITVTTDLVDKEAGINTGLMLGIGLLVLYVIAKKR